MTARLLLLGVLYVVVEARSVEKVDVAPGKHCRLCLSSAFLTSCSTCVVGCPLEYNTSHCRHYCQLSTWTANDVHKVHVGESEVLLLSCCFCNDCKIEITMQEVN